MTFVYLLKEKTQDTVAAALREHFNLQGLKLEDADGEYINFYVRGTVLRTDRGSEFINTTVLAFCKELGCIPHYSSPGQQGKYQNGVVEQRMKKIGRISTSIMHIAHFRPTRSSCVILRSSSS